MAFFYCFKLKKIRYIIITAIIIISLLLLAKFLFRVKPAFDFSLSNEKNLTDIDLNGDGTMDKVYINKITNGYVYYVELNTKKFTLIDEKGNDVLFTLESSYSPKINFEDFDRDNIPEIILLGMDQSKPKSYIFKWTGEEFKMILTSTNNINGILYKDTTRTPLFLTCLSSKGDESTMCYVLDGTAFKGSRASSTKILGLHSLQKFIDIIQLTYELEDTPNIFTDNIDSNQLGLLWNLDKSKFNYSFQFAYFNDSNWDKDFSPNKIQWILSFEKINKLDTNSFPSETLFKVTTVKTIDNSYKISSISIIK